MRGPPDPTELGPLTLWVDGRTVHAEWGDTVAGALLAAGIRVLRRTAGRGEPRGLYCCMGACYECVVFTETDGFVRACMTPAREGMQLRIGGIDGGELGA